MLAVPFSYYYFYYEERDTTQDVEERQQKITEDHFYRQSTRFIALFFGPFCVGSAALSPRISGGKRKNLAGHHDLMQRVQTAKVGGQQKERREV